MTHSLCMAPWSGTPCQTTSTHSRTISPLDRAWKSGFSPDTSVFNTLETFVIIALYKSTLTIPYPSVSEHWRKEAVDIFKAYFTFPFLLGWLGSQVVSMLDSGAEGPGCHCHSLSFASVKSRLVVPFWYWLTWVVLDKGPLIGCVCGWQ